MKNDNTEENENLNLLEEYLTVEQVEQQLGITRRTLIRWDTSRVGPPTTRIGRRVLYRVTALKDWLAYIEGKDMKQIELDSRRAAHERGKRGATKSH